MSEKISSDFRDHAEEIVREINLKKGMNAKELEDIEKLLASKK